MHICMGGEGLDIFLLFLLLQLKRERGLWQGRLVFECLRCGGVQGGL